MQTRYRRGQDSRPQARKRPAPISRSLSRLTPSSDSHHGASREDQTPALRKQCGCITRCTCAAAAVAARARRLNRLSAQAALVPHEHPRPAAPCACYVAVRTNHTAFTTKVKASNAQERRGRRCPISMAVPRARPPIGRRSVLTEPLPDEYSRTAYPRRMTLTATMPTYKERRSIEGSSTAAIGTPHLE